MSYQTRRHRIRMTETTNENRSGSFALDHALTFRDRRCRSSRHVRAQRSHSWTAFGDDDYAGAIKEDSSWIKTQYFGANRSDAGAKKHSQEEVRNQSRQGQQAKSYEEHRSSMLLSPHGSCGEHNEGQDRNRRQLHRRQSERRREPNEAVSKSTRRARVSEKAKAFAKELVSANNLPTTCPPIVCLVPPLIPAPLDRVEWLR